MGVFYQNSEPKVLSWCIYTYIYIYPFLAVLNFFTKFCLSESLICVALCLQQDFIPKDGNDCVQVSGVYNVEILEMLPYSIIHNHNTIYSCNSTANLNAGHFCLNLLFCNIEAKNKTKQFIISGNFLMWLVLSFIMCL